MKKVISICLAILMLLPVVSVFAGASKRPSREYGFAFATDLHYVHPLSDAKERMLDLYPNLCMGSRNNLQSESGFIIDEFLRQCAENDSCEFVLISGDLVTYGRERTSDHEELAQKFRDFEKNTGKQIYVINGNHDNGLGYSTDYKKFCEIYYEFGYDTAFSRDETCCSYATELNDDYILIALDSFDEQYMLASGVDTARLKWVKEQCDYAKEKGKYPIVIMHHNLLEHQPLEAIVNDKYIVSFPKSVATMFAEWGIKLVFSGHTHTNDVSSFTTTAGSKVYEFCNSALSTYPLEYKTFKLGESTISYETKSVDNIDADALTSVITSGYSEHEIDLINNDFKQFVKEYNVGNAMSVIKNGISPEFLGFDEGSLFYDSVKELTDTLNSLMAKPLYGEGGVKEIAQSVGVEIPETSYENVYGVAEQLYIDVLTGNRNYEFESPEIEIVLGTVETAIELSLDGSTSESLYIIASVITSNFGVSLPVDATGTAEYLALAVASPFIYEYINSTDGLDNRNGAISGYGSSESRLDNIADSLNTSVSNLMLYIDMISKFLTKLFNAVFGGVA